MEAVVTSKPRRAQTQRQNYYSEDTKRRES